MKKTCSLIIVAAALLAQTGCYFHVSNSSGGWFSSDLKVTTNLVQNAAIPASIKSLDVVNAFGSVRIIGSDTAPAAWSQKLNVRAKTDAVAQDIASNTLCQTEVVGDTLKLVVKVPVSSEPHGFTSDLEITVPKSVAVQCRNQYGPTDISGLSRDVGVTSQFGTVDVRDIGESVRAQTSYAALRISHTGPATLRNQFGVIEASDVRGPVEAETSYALLDAHDISGPVKLRNQFGAMHVERTGEANLRTSYAELRAKDINGDAHLVNQFGRVAAEAITGSVKAETSYGPMDIIGAGTNFVCDNQFGGISVRATSPALASLEARTSYASLEVRLPASLKPAVQAHTSYGDVESDFPVLMKAHGADAFGNVPPGTARITLHNQNGQIRLKGEL